MKFWVVKIFILLKNKKGVVAAEIDTNVFTRNTLEVLFKLKTKIFMNFCKSAKFA